MSQSWRSYEPLLILQTPEQFCYNAGIRDPTTPLASPLQWSETIGRKPSWRSHDLQLVMPLGLPAGHLRSKLQTRPTRNLVFPGVPGGGEAAAGNAGKEVGWAGLCSNERKHPPGKPGALGASPVVAFTVCTTSELQNTARASRGLPFWQPPVARTFPACFGDLLSGVRPPAGASGSPIAATPSHLTYLRINMEYMARSARALLLMAGPITIFMHIWQNLKKMRERLPPQGPCGVISIWGRSAQPGRRRAKKLGKNGASDCPRRGLAV